MGHILDELSRHPSAPPAGSQPQGSQPLGPVSVPDHAHPYPQPSGTDLASLVRLLQTQPGWVQTAMQVSPLLAYVQVSASQGGITTEADLTGLSATITLATARRIRLSASFDIQTSVAGDVARSWIKEGATYLQSCDTDMRLVNQRYRAIFQVVIARAAGVWSYKLAASRTSGTGTLTMTANGISSGIDPAFFMVEDVGPSP